MTIQQLIHIILIVSGLKEEAVLTLSRKREAVKARQFIHFFVWKHFKQKMTLQDIADITGNSHCNVLYSISQVNDLEFLKNDIYLSMKKDIEERIRTPKKYFIFSKYSTVSYLKN